MKKLISSFVYGFKYRIERTYHPSTLDKSSSSCIAIFTGYEKEDSREIATFVTREGEKLRFDTENLNKVDTNSNTFELWVN